MSGVISVESGIPMPTRSSKYPYEELSVGDSFLVTDIPSQIVSNNNWRMSKKLGRRFVAKKVDGGVRVWRIT